MYEAHENNATHPPGNAQVLGGHTDLSVSLPRWAQPSLRAPACACALLGVQAWARVRSGGHAGLATRHGT